MKTRFYLFVFAILFFALVQMAQETQPAARPKAKPTAPETKSAGSYTADLDVVHDSQRQALEQAREMLDKADGPAERSALESAIKEMERAEAALAAARNSPEKLPAAIAAEQAAYQALLKASSREYRMSRSRNRSQNGSAGQAGQRQMDQLDMQAEENRYETERQASAPQTAKQREQVQTVDRLKELSQRQQDLNGRLRELQTALQAARTDQEREEIQRQLKRLQDEQRQMLAKVDELRQKLEQSPNAESQADTRQQLDQTRSDMERAAQEMDRQSPSDALAAGTRAQERMQNMRDDLRKQSSSQFAEQMKQLRNEARELKQQQEEIARGLESLNDRKALDSTAERQDLVKQMDKQQSTLTNLLSGMRNVTEQADATEPLLSKQLYDTLRRADQMRTENLLQLGSQLTERGFLPQASQVARATRTNVTELARSVERAADSVLGSEADALRYAEKELDDLTHQVEREMAAGNTNASSPGPGGTNRTPGRPGNLSSSDQKPSTDNNRQLAQNSQPSQEPGEGQPAAEQSGDGNDQSPQDANRAPQGQQGQQAARGQNGSRQGNRQTANNNASNAPNQGGNSGDGSAAEYGPSQLRRWAEQLGGGGDASGPIMGNDYANWVDRLRDVEQVVDPADLRNQLATARERASALRSDFRQRGRKPDTNVVRQQILAPLAQVRVWLHEELARKEKADTLVPLDRDPVPDNYAELVRKYYEKLGSAQ